MMVLHELWDNHWFAIVQRDAIADEFSNLDPEDFEPVFAELCLVMTDAIIQQIYCDERGDILWPSG